MDFYCIMGLRPKPLCVFLWGAAPSPFVFPLWGAAPSPVHLFEKRWSQKLLIRCRLVQTHHPMGYLVLWGTAPNPVHLFEKRWSQKLLMSIGFSTNTAPDGFPCKIGKYFNLFCRDRRPRRSEQTQKLYLPRKADELSERTNQRLSLRESSRDGG